MGAEMRCGAGKLSAWLDVGRDGLRGRSV